MHYRINFYSKLSFLFLFFFLTFYYQNAIALTVEEIMQLKKAGVSEEVILKMIKKESIKQKEIDTSKAKSGILTVHRKYRQTIAPVQIGRIEPLTSNGKVLYFFSQFSERHRNPKNLPIDIDHDQSFHFCVKPGKYFVEISFPHKYLEPKGMEVHIDSGEEKVIQIDVVKPLFGDYKATLRLIR